MILANAGRSLRNYPRLLDRLGIDAAASRFAAVHGVAVSRETWRGWLIDLEDADVVDSLAQVTVRMLSEGALPIDDAIAFVELARQRYARSGRFSDEGEHFWRLIKAVCDRLTPSHARRFLRSVLPSFALVHSSGGDRPGSFYHGLNYAPTMIDAVNSIRQRSSPRAFEAWASATLLRAYVQEYRQWGDFHGREFSGSQSDNAWVTDVIVPSMREALSPDGLAERLRTHHITHLHPAFRLRAIIASAPIGILEMLSDTMQIWRRMSNSGLPPLGDALEGRSGESDLIAEQGLDDSLERFGRPTSATQSARLHGRLALKDRRAIAATRLFLADPQFVQFDFYTTHFFERLDWADRHPRLAVELLAIALRAGYPMQFLGFGPAYRTIMDLVLRKGSLRQLVSGIPGMNDQFAYALHGSSPR